MRPSSVSCLGTLACTTLLCASSLPGWAAPDRESLLTAWEELQRSDPQVQLFEKIEPGLYRFQTDRFPFDGQLRVLNTAIDAGYGQYMTGVVEVELVDAPDDFFQKYAQSYGMWHGNNYAYYDPDQDRWVTSAEFSEEFAAEYACPWWADSVVWYVVLGLIVVLLLFVARRANMQIREAMAAQKRVLADHEKVMESTRQALELSQRSLTHAEQQTRILGEILDELRRTA